MKTYKTTIVLGIILVGLSLCSLFVGAIDITTFQEMELKIFLVSRIPRLLAILCSGIGLSVAGLLMQQLCRNKFVSPSTGATIQSAQFGILLSFIIIPSIGFWGRIRKRRLEQL